MENESMYIKQLPTLPRDDPNYSYLSNAYTEGKVIYLTESEFRLLQGIAATYVNVTPTSPGLFLDRVAAAVEIRDYGRKPVDAQVLVPREVSDRVTALGKARRDYELALSDWAGNGASSATDNPYFKRYRETVVALGALRDALELGPGEHST
jgi:hypothetical protein